MSCRLRTLRGRCALASNLGAEVDAELEADIPGLVPDPNASKAFSSAKKPAAVQHLQSS